MKQDIEIIDKAIVSTEESIASIRKSISFTERDYSDTGHIPSDDSALKGALEKQYVEVLNKMYDLKDDLVNLKGKIINFKKSVKEE